MRQRYGLVVFIVGMAFALAACQRAVQRGETARELQQVQQQVSERVGTQVGVNLNIGRFMSIDITNSPWEDIAPAERRQKALEIARLAYAGFSARSRVEVVTVTFAVRRTYFKFVPHSKATGVFQFGRDDLAPNLAGPALSERWVPKEIPQSDLYFVAIGGVPPPLLDDMVSHFEQKLGMRITILPELSFDRVTFDPVRSQTVADELISAVRRRYATLARDDRARVIGVTPHDMYMQAMGNQWRFTFSLRSSDNHFAVVSYARMDPANLAKPPDTDRLRTRLRKMVAKNIGIMYYGLPISRDPRSVLYGQIGGADELDRMTEYFEPQ